MPASVSDSKEERERRPYDTTSDILLTGGDRSAVSESKRSGGRYDNSILEGLQHTSGGLIITLYGMRTQRVVVVTAFVDIVVVWHIVLNMSLHYFTHNVRYFLCISRET